ncbi:putative zinc-binding protein, partial [Klebsiella pneumoniae]
KSAQIREILISESAWEEMTCLFAPSLAKSGRPILALDGCPLECVKNCLAVHNVVPAQHIMLNELGVKKRQQTDFDLDEANALLIKIAEIAHSLPIMETAGSGTPIN